MTAKEYLMQYRESMERTAEIETHLHELKAEAIRLKDHEGQSVTLDDAVAKYTDACDEYGHELNRLEALRREIKTVINSVQNGRLRAVLYHRYILGETWEQIAVNLHYHYTSVCRQHGQALKEIAQIIK